MNKIELLKELLNTNTKIIEMKAKVEKIKTDSESFYVRHNTNLTDLIINTFIEIQLETDGISGWDRDTREYIHKPSLLQIISMMLECEIFVPYKRKSGSGHLRDLGEFQYETEADREQRAWNWEEYEKHKKDITYDYLSPIVLKLVNNDRLQNGHLFSVALDNVEKYMYSVYKPDKENVFGGGYNIFIEQLELLLNYKQKLELELEKIS